MADESSWRTPAFRQSVVAKIDEAIRQSGMNTSRNSIEMENHVFQKAKNKEEYLGFVARLILHVREMKKLKENGVIINEFIFREIDKYVVRKPPPKLIEIKPRSRVSVSDDGCLQ